MHSSRMHTIHCSGHLRQIGCLPREGLQGGAAQTPPIPVNRITDRCKKHYFSATTVMTVNIEGLLKVEIMHC